MGAVLPERDLPIAEYLIGSLDDKGYLAARVEDIAYELETDVDRVRAVLARAAGAGPGRHRRAQSARVPAACRSIISSERGLSQPYAREIVSQFLTELGEHKFARIAHELKISPDVGLGRVGVRQAQAESAPGPRLFADQRQRPRHARDVHHPGRHHHPGQRRVSRSKSSRVGASRCASTRCTRAWRRTCAAAAPA